MSSTDPFVRAQSILTEVLVERLRQVEREGFSQAHDDVEHAYGQLAAASACYAHHTSIQLDGRHSGAVLPDDLVPDSWPWDAEWWKPKEPRRNLIIAAALLLAEVERLDRAAAKKAPAT